MITTTHYPLKIYLAIKNKKLNIIYGFDKFLTYMCRYKVTNSTTKPFFYMGKHVRHLIFTQRKQFSFFFSKQINKHIYNYVGWFFFLICALYNWFRSRYNMCYKHLMHNAMVKMQTKHKVIEHTHQVQLQKKKIQTYNWMCLLLLQNY